MSGISKLRYRPPPIQPMNIGTGEVHHSTKKRLKEVVEFEQMRDEDQYRIELEEKEGTEKLDLEAGASATNVNYLPDSTQYRTKEAIIMSDEAKFRHENYPTIQDKMEVHRQFLKTKHKEEMMKQMLAEKLKKMEEKRIRDEERRIEQSKKRRGIMKLVPGAGSGADTFEVDDEEPDEFGEDPEDAAYIKDHAEYKLAVLVSKEKRLTNQRLTARQHKTLGKFYILRTQIILTLQLAPTNSLYTQILPWLYVGRGTIAQNIHSLSKLSTTHILNVSKEVPNYFPATFGIIQLLFIVYFAMLLNLIC